MQKANNVLATRVRHAVNLGDLAACLAPIKKYWEVTGRKVILSQQVNMPAAYYPGATHPTVDEMGTMVTMNEFTFDMVKPLVEAQPYIHCMEKYEGQKIDLDFNVIRQKTFVNLPHGAIQNWIVFAFPDLAFDLSKPWVELPGKCPKRIKDQVEGKVIINFTERYRNSIIDYFFLKNYAPDLIFAGTEREHFLFCNQWQLSIPRLEVTNFLDSAYALKEARFMVGNQSFLWNLAEALKTPRVLEVCQYAQNCINGVGEHSYGYFHQVGADYYFRKMYNETAKKKTPLKRGASKRVVKKR